MRNEVPAAEFLRTSQASFARPGNETETFTFDPAGGSGDRDGPPCDGALLPDVPTPGDDAAGTMGLPSSSGGFTKNLGQLPNNDVRFYSPGGDVWFTDDGVWYDIGDPDGEGGITLKQEFVGAEGGTVQGEIALTIDGWETVDEFYYEITAPYVALEETPVSWDEWLLTVTVDAPVGPLCFTNTCDGVFDR